MNYEALFATPAGRTSRRDYIGAVVTLLAAFAFYYWLVWGASGRFGMLVMLYPATVLHARRLRDMGHTPWLLAAPVALLIAAFWLRATSPGTPAQSAVAWAAFAVSAAFVLWGLTGRGRTGAV
jgi:uncharacterized membrane protein YhaH (DUF805 family)